MKNNKSTMSENILEPRLVGELTLPKNNYRFFIPSYQRGYRWDKIEVTALLDDLLEFLLVNTNKSETYCLQPVVVKELNDGSYEVLDGQQRLTTLFILLSYLKKDDSEINLFKLEYETRKDSESFLQNLSNEINNQNPDYYYISQAYNCIDSWFDEKSNSITRLKRKFGEIILDQLEIIWYEIKDDSNPIDVFTRINIGKIPLTNSELVKAIFLSKTNLQIGLSTGDDKLGEGAKKIEEAILNNKQSVIALEWDGIEKQLQDEQFWSFIFNHKENNYQTRIDYILDLITKSSVNKKDNLDSFNKYYTDIKLIKVNKEALDDLKRSNSSFVEHKWAELKSYFDILLEWYDDKWYNHIIGFLISRDEKVLDLLDNYKNNNREGFKKDLISKVEKHISVKDISELQYGNKNDNKIIENILVFHNVIGSLIQPDTSIHFPFDKINNSKWSLEHIYAQNSDELLEKDYPLWVTDHLNYFKSLDKNNDETIKELISELEKLHGFNFEKNKEDFKTDFNKVFSNVEDFIKRLSNSNEEDLDEEFKNYQWVTNEHSIANLTLLDIGSNSYLSNSLFAIKREKIKELDLVATYIPNETRKVFFKYYSTSGGHDAYWTIEDRIAYVKEIEFRIKELNNLLTKK